MLTYAQTTQVQVRSCVCAWLLGVGGRLTTVAHTAMNRDLVGGLTERCARLVGGTRCNRDLAGRLVPYGRIVLKGFYAFPKVRRRSWLHRVRYGYVTCARKGQGDLRVSRVRVCLYTY